MQLLLNSWQFPREERSTLAAGLTFYDPNVTFEDRITLDVPERPIEIFASPSETDDCIAIWVLKQRLLYGGPTVINGFPDIGTPLRIQRLTRRWVESLEAVQRHVDNGEWQLALHVIDLVAMAPGDHDVNGFLLPTSKSHGPS